MNNKVKFFVILLAAIITSACTSYITTTNNSVNQPLTKTNVISYLKLSDSVDVVCDVALHNLTIVYEYTPVDRDNGWLNESVKIRAVDYGDYFPTRSPGVPIKLGDHCSQLYAVPEDLLISCSHPTADNYRYYFTVLEVYGYR